MRGKISLESSLYPSDKALSDIILAQKITRKRLTQFLKERGIFVQFDHVSEFARVISSMFLDHEDIDELLSAAATKESKLKCSSSEFTSEEDTIETIFERLSSGDLKNDEDLGLRLLGSTATPTINLKERMIEIRQPFATIDYTKSALMQEEHHEFTVRIQEVADGRFEMNYLTSNLQSESYVKQYRARMEGQDAKIGYLHEIRKAALDSERLNKFFDSLLKSPKLGCTLLSALRVGLEKGETLALDEETLDELSLEQQVLAGAARAPSEDDEGDESREESDIRYVTLDGSDLWKHADVRRYRSEGYNIRSVGAMFRCRQSGSADLELLINLSFNTYGKFHAEIIKCWQVLLEEKNRRERWNLQPYEKEAFLGSVNRAALAIFDSLIEKTRTPKKKRPKAAASAPELGGI